MLIWGGWYVTPLLAVLVVIEATDVIGVDVSVLVILCVMSAAIAASLPSIRRTPRPGSGGERHAFTDPAQA